MRSKHLTLLLTTRRTHVHAHAYVHMREHNSLLPPLRIMYAPPFAHAGDASRVRSRRHQVKDACSDAGGHRDNALIEIKHEPMYTMERAGILTPTRSSHPCSAPPAHPHTLPAHSALATTSLAPTNGHRAFCIARAWGFSRPPSFAWLPHTAWVSAQLPCLVVVICLDPINISSHLSPGPTLTPARARTLRRASICFAFAHHFFAWGL